MMNTISDKSIAKFETYLPYVVLITFVLCIIGVTIAVVVNNKIGRLQEMAIKNNDLLEGRTPLFQNLIQGETDLSERLGKLEGKMDFILQALEHKVDKQ